MSPHQVSANTVSPTSGHPFVLCSGQTLRIIFYFSFQPISEFHSTPNILNLTFYCHIDIYTNINSSEEPSLASQIHVLLTITSSILCYFIFFMTLLFPETILFSYLCIPYLPHSWKVISGEELDKFCSVLLLYTFSLVWCLIRSI